MIRDWLNMSRGRRRGNRALLKDPIALFSAEWIADRFDADVMVLIRHPAAFVGSLTRGEGTHHPFSHFLKQPLLMERYLQPYDDQIRRFAERELPPLDQAILLWNIIHSMILGYRKRRPNWLFVRHEDLSRNPVGEYRAIFESLDLPFTDEVEQTIIDSTHTSDAKNRDRGLVRESKANIWSWKRRLSEDQIAKVREQTREVAEQFYSDADWEDEIAESPTRGPGTAT